MKGSEQFCSTHKPEPAENKSGYMILHASGFMKFVVKENIRKRYTAIQYIESVKETAGLLAISAEMKKGGFSDSVQLTEKNVT